MLRRPRNRQRVIGQGPCLAEATLGGGEYGPGVQHAVGREGAADLTGAVVTAFKLGGHAGQIAALQQGVDRAEPSLQLDVWCGCPFPQRHHASRHLFALVEPVGMGHDNLPRSQGGRQRVHVVASLGDCHRLLAGFRRPFGVG